MSLIGFIWSGYVLLQTLSCYFSYFINLLIRISKKRYPILCELILWDFAILQFLQDLLDSLFSILMQNTISDVYDNLVFDALVSIIILHDEAYII